MSYDAEAPSCRIAFHLNDFLCEQWQQATERELPRCLLSQEEDGSSHSVSWQASAGCLTPMLTISNDAKCSIEHDKHGDFSKPSWDLSKEADQRQLVEELLAVVLGWLT